MGPGRHVRRARRLRAMRLPLIAFACAFALASGTAAFAYTTVSADGSGQAQAVTLQAPGAITIARPTATSLFLSWTPSSGLPTDGGYLVLRSSTPDGPYDKVTDGTCQQNLTIVSAATSCTDTGLAAGTTYSYEIVAAYYTVETLWMSPPDAASSGTTSRIAGDPIPSSPGPTTSGTTTPGAPVITSASSSTFFVGTQGTFQVATTGMPAPTFSDKAFMGCTPSTLPVDITFSAAGLVSGSPAAGDVGSYTLCVNAANGVTPAATQKFTLSVADQTLVFSSPPVAGSASGEPNLGPITVRRQTAAGAPITAGALAVNLSSSPAAGTAFGSAQFTASHAATITIPAGESSASFWFGSVTPGSPIVTVAATGAVSASQLELITAAPAGLGVALGAGGTGSAVLSCGSPGLSAACIISGVGAGGNATVSIGFRNTGGAPAVYSSTQPSVVTESSPSAGTETIAAGASSSEFLTLPAGTTRFSFGPYTLTVTLEA